MILHAFVSGRVQGVFFRANTKKTAVNLGLTGWVKNLKDGRVEVLAEGKKQNLIKLVDFLKKGSSAAKVQEVNYELRKEMKNFKDFTIKY